MSQAQDTVTIEAAGRAAVIEGNTSAARDAAIADALRKAVEEAVGTLVSSDTATENFQVISDNVYTRSQGYVKTYSVISEAVSADVAEVRVRAAVSVSELKGDISAMGLLQKKAGRPRVLFMVAEKGIGKIGFKFWWQEGQGTFPISATEAALKEAFLAKGFNVADITGSLDGEGPSGAFRSGDVTADGARHIGRRLNAEVVVYGKSILEEGPSTGSTSVVTYAADIVVQAIRVDDGALLASAKGRAISRHISSSTGESEAIGRAASIAADSLAAQLAQRWSGPHYITIKVKGADYDKVVEFKRLLKMRVRGIEAIYQRRHEGKETTLEVESRDGSGIIADGISKLAGWKVTGFSSDSIEVQGAE